MKIGILEHKYFSQNAIDELSKLGEVSFFDNNSSEFYPEINIIFIRLKYFIGFEILNKAPNLKYICSPTTGLNHIDLNETSKRGIYVISLKNQFEFLKNIRATPEHTFGLIIALLRNYNKAFLNPENNYWNRNLFIGNELYENKIGIIGFGRVGQLLAKYLQAFDTETYFYDKNPQIKSVYGANKVNSIKGVIKNTEIVLLCASFDYATAPILKSEHFDLMQNKYFINSSRGELIDENYLLKKIELNFFKGVAIDVLANETGNNNLKGFLNYSKTRNLIITPHISGATYASLNRTEEFIVQKLKTEIKSSKR